jgi:hypothetical protein
MPMCSMPMCSMPVSRPVNRPLNRLHEATASLTALFDVDQKSPDAGGPPPIAPDWIRSGAGRSPAGNRFEGPHPAFRTSGSASCSIVRWRSNWPLVTVAAVTAAVTAAAAVTTVAESCSSALLAPNFEDRKSPALSGSPLLVRIYPSCLLAVSHCRSIMLSFRSSGLTYGSLFLLLAFWSWGSGPGVLVLPLRSATQHC